MSYRRGDKAINMAAGETLQVHVPVNPTAGEGWFPVKGNINFVGVPGDENVRTLVNGWCMENEEAGTIVALADKVGITYTHEYPMVQYLYFFAASGENGVVSIVPAPIHDHSSITQGGPAFGTYFRDRNE